MTQRPVPPGIDSGGLGNGVRAGFSAIYNALLLVRGIKIVLPLLIYFLIELIVIVLYARSGPGTLDGLWALFLPGRGADTLGHYPQRLLLLPELMGSLDVVFDVLLQVVAQGITVLLVASALVGKPLNLARSFGLAMRRYWHLIGVMFIATVIMMIITYLPVLLSSLGWTSRNRYVEIVAYVALGILSQAFFLYAVPYVLLDNDPFHKALVKSFRFALKRYPLSLTLAAVPFIVIMPTFLLELKAQIISLRIFPELIIYIQILGDIMKLVSGYILVGGVTVVYMKANPGRSLSGELESETQ